MLAQSVTPARVPAGSGGLQRRGQPCPAGLPAGDALADRNFAGWELWGLVTAAGADMAWRIKKNLVLPPVA